MTIIKTFKEIHSEMYQELEAFLINLSIFKDVAEEGSVDVAVENFYVSISDHIIEDSEIIFRWTYYESDEEDEVELNWHDLINNHMKESELSEFYDLLNNYREQMKKSLLDHGITDEYELKRYVEINNICSLALGKLAIQKYWDCFINAA
jgi:hypothetical protein